MARERANVQKCAVAMCREENEEYGRNICGIPVRDGG